MRRVRRSERELAWLSSQPEHEGATGYSPAGWEADVWVLHAMYENPMLKGHGSHDDVRHRLLETGAAEPDIIGGINFDDIGTLTGAPLGFVAPPGRSWQRMRWDDYANRDPDVVGSRTYPPCHRWFSHSSWPASMQPPPEGSLDQESLDALLEMLASQAPDGAATRCYAFYAALPANDFDSTHLWRGPLTAVRSLVEGHGGPYGFTPTNMWPQDRSWFVWTDYDLQGTRVSGPAALIETIKADPRLETVNWSPPGDSPPR